MKHAVPHSTATVFGHSRDTDYYGWLLEQARALRSSRNSQIDREALVEEVEAMAASLRRPLVSHLEVLLAHLLKWAWEPDKRSGSWEASIGNARDSVADLLADSPSLKTYMEESLRRAYPRARRTAGAEMGLGRKQWEGRLPASCPWPLADVMNEDFWPGDRAQM
jgi:hypothetical protein